MAAIGGVLAAQLLPTVIPLVVRMIERLFGNKNGAVKFAGATEVVTALGTGLASIGQTPLPVLDETKKAIQGVVDGLNAAGELKGHATELGPPGSFNGAERARLMFAGLLQIIEASK